MMPFRDLQTRIRGILTHPAAEWPVIAAERSDVQTLMLGYAAPLVAIPAICRWIGATVIGAYRGGIVRGLVSAVVSWAFALGGLYVAAFVVDRVGPTFKSRVGIVPALKLVVYASTPVWIVGVLNLVPVFVPLTLLAALYGAYLFSVGLPPVAHTPADQVVPYMFVATMLTIVVFVALELAAGAIAGVGA